MNGLTGALTGALAGFELCLAPYAAETVIAASAPFGMSVFGQFVSAGALVDLTASGFCCNRSECPVQADRCHGTGEWS